MKELKEWIEYNIFNLKKKIDYMKKHTPDHRNIKWFEGQLVSNEKTLTKINELSKKVVNDTRGKYRIGRIVKPKEVSWLSEDKKKEYLKQMGWENLPNAVINGFIWTQYLNEHDYKYVYLADVDNSKEEIIKQIIEQIKK